MPITIELVGIDKFGTFFVVSVIYLLGVKEGYIHFDPSAIGVFSLLLAFIVLIPLEILNIVSILISIVKNYSQGKSKIIAYASLASSIYLLIKVIGKQVLGV
jgi:hypothetical protein